MWEHVGQNEAGMVWWSMSQCTGAVRVRTVRDWRVKMMHESGNNDEYTCAIHVFDDSKHWFQDSMGDTDVVMTDVRRSRTLDCARRTQAHVIQELISDTRWHLHVRIARYS